MRIKRTQLLLLSLFLVTVLATFGQSEKQAIRQGNRDYKKGDYLESEISYRSALEQNPSSFKGNFNLGGALYKQENYEDATKIFEDLSASNASAKDKAKIYHNLGNTLFQQKKYAESVDAYKNALRHNPDDIETKYNLAQAQRMLIQQQQQQQQQQNNEGDSKNDDKRDQNKEQDKQQENKDKEEDQQNKEQDQQKDQQKQQQNEQQISPEDARRMLEALQNNERDVQDRVREQQAKAAKVRVEKNW